MYSRRSIRWLAALLTVVGASWYGYANQGQELERAYRDGEHLVSVKALFDEIPRSVIGETIHYPGGTPAEINAVRITIPPGGNSAPHKHGVPLFIYVLSGAMEVDYGGKGVRTFAAGTAFMEAMDHPHQGYNKGSEPVEILAVYLGAKGAENVIRE